MPDIKSGLCGGASNLVFSCSGAADVGAIADLTARKLNAEGSCRMYCLTGIGGRVPGILATTDAAEKIVVIDGCNLDCARKTLEQAGKKRFHHVRLYDLGMEKGKSPATPERIAVAAQKVREVLKETVSETGGGTCG